MCEFIGVDNFRGHCFFAGHIRVLHCIKVNTLNWKTLLGLCLNFKYVLGMPDRLDILVR